MSFRAILSGLVIFGTMHGSVADQEKENDANTLIFV